MVTKLPKAESPLEAEFALQCRLFRLPVPARQYKFLEDRKFLADFCWPDNRLIVECNGEVHRIKEMFERDMEKTCLAVVHGWVVLSVGRKLIYNGQAIEWVKLLLKGVQNEEVAR